MGEDQSKRRLGRGLAALIGDVDLNGDPAHLSHSIKYSAEQGGAPLIAERYVSIELITRNPRNPRRKFSDSELDDLAQSIRKHGVVQPVIVRPLPDRPNRFELVAGERRWCAAQRANISQLPVIVRDVDDKTALELAIIENVQRAELNPIEEGMGYELLLSEHGYSQTDLAKIIGKSRSYIANTLRLLKLPQKVRQFLIDGQLSSGHARCLVTVDNQQDLAEKIIREGLSVRQVEMLVQEQENSAIKKRVSAEKDAKTRSLEKLLTNVIGMRVSIQHGKRGGNLKIHYTSLEELNDICRRLQE